MGEQGQTVRRALPRLLRQNVLISRANGSNVLPSFSSSTETNGTSFAMLVVVEIHGSHSDRRLALAEQILAREGEKPISLPEG